MELAGNDDHIKYNTIQKDIEKEVFDIRYQFFTVGI